MRHVPEHITSEQLWIARLFDASCRDGQDANASRPATGRVNDPQPLRASADESTGDRPQWSEAPLLAEVRPSH